MGVDGLEANAAEYAALEARPLPSGIRPSAGSSALCGGLRRRLEALEPLHTDATRLRGLQGDPRSTHAKPGAWRAHKPAWTPGVEEV
ncbi:hypothetical protein [Actinomadura sp. 9N215]|uniref:hypothetical protein n=1 Tax=Actinomadura sp. 9N215 TaxID=3375150 RepID=UPI00379D7C86